jgi:hypothetical protein
MDKCRMDAPSTIHILKFVDVSTCWNQIDTEWSAVVLRGRIRWKQPDPGNLEIFVMGRRIMYQWFRWSWWSFYKKAPAATLHSLQWGPSQISVLKNQRHQYMLCLTLLDFPVPLKFFQDHPVPIVLWSDKLGWKDRPDFSVRDNRFKYSILVKVRTSVLVK